MAYHVTLKDNMQGIINKGLIPMCGINSKRVNDNIVGVFFDDSLYSAIEEWSNLLYENKRKEDLEILKLNIKNRKWITQSNGDYYIPGSWYLERSVDPDNIDFLRVVNNGNLEHADDTNDLYYDESNLIWTPIKTYKQHVQ